MSIIQQATSLESPEPRLPERGSNRDTNHTRLGNTRVTWNDVEDVVGRIVQAAAPDKVILFGSAARGDMSPHSDLDFLVIKAEADHRELSSRIRMALFGANAAVDLVIATPGDIERYGASHCLIYKPALREGLVVYGQP